ncbi:MAG: DUF4244 domain-containing protein [Acidimicrobiales bacterium]
MPECPDPPAVPAAPPSNPAAPPPVPAAPPSNPTVASPAARPSAPPPPVPDHRRPDPPAHEAGQATAEYALVVLAAAALAGLLLAWAAGADGIGQLFDAVLRSLLGRVE